MQKIKMKVRAWRMLGVLAVLVAALGTVGTLSGTARAQENPATWDWMELTPTQSSPGAVRAAQYLLRARGYTLGVDGSFGSQTRDRVRRFQEARGLKVSGNVDSATWASLIMRVRRGSSGSQVRAVQALLRAIGYTVALDGNFGAQTERVVKQFQHDKELTEDGVVGPKTWCDLELASAEDD